MHANGQQHFWKDPADADPRAGLIIEFFMAPIEMTAKSKKHKEETGEDHKFYEDREHLRILLPNDVKSEVVKLVTDAEREKFAFEYEKFKAKEGAGSFGTSLQTLTGITPHQIAMFDRFNIWSVESLAAVGDSTIQQMGMGAKDWRTKARMFTDRAPVDPEKEALKAEMAEMKAQMAELLAMKRSEMPALPEGTRPYEEPMTAAEELVARRGPGRPRKEPAELDVA